MRIWAFSLRTCKEILRDPLNLGFGIGFPVALLLLLSAIQANIPVSLFEIATLAPGMPVFGLSFMTLFSAVLVSKDRESAFLRRLYATPMTAADFICGYTLPILPIAVAQGLVCYLVSVCLGLRGAAHILFAVLLLIPVALFFIALGLLCGTLLSSKQVGGLCGALLTNLTAWLSGIWFDLNLVGGVFRKIANALPFVHAVELERAVFNGGEILPHLLVVAAYAAVAAVAAVAVFLRRMRAE